MFRRIFDAIILAIVVGLTLEVIKSLVPYVPIIWLAVLAFYTWEFATSGFVLSHLGNIKVSLKGNKLGYYAIVGTAGAVLFCLYWWGLTTFFAPKIAAYELEKKPKINESNARISRREAIRVLPPWMTAKSTIDLDGVTTLKLSMPANQDIVTLMVGAIASHQPDKTTSSLIERDATVFTGYSTLTFDRFRNKSHVVRANSGRSFTVTLLEINTLVDPPEFEWSKEYVFGIVESDPAEAKAAEEHVPAAPAKEMPSQSLADGLFQPEGSISFRCPEVGDHGEPNTVFLSAGPNRTLLVDTANKVVKFVMTINNHQTVRREMPLGIPTEGRHFIAVTWNQNDTGLFVDGVGIGLLTPP